MLYKKYVKMTSNSTEHKKTIQDTEKQRTQTYINLCWTK